MIGDFPLVIGPDGDLFDEEPPPLPPRNLPLETQRSLSVDPSSIGAVSSITRTLTKGAKRLYVYDPSTKLKHSDTYDIGGTYADTGLSLVPELWFFYSSTVCPGQNYLLNLFVCQRNPGSCTIGISNTKDISFKKKSSDRPGLATLSEVISWHSFRSTQPDEYFHIKTYCFDERELKTLENNTLVIPIKIDMNITFTPKNDVIKKIKLNHDFGDILAKQEKTDFILVSVSQKRYPVHKIFLAAHSPVLRDLIKSKAGLPDENVALIDIPDNEMELMLQFIYTGTIKNILKQDCLNLLQIADRFRLTNLFSLTQLALTEQINVENAVDIASISEKYKLDKLQMKVFNFIKNNPKVLETDGWKNLNDVNLAKKLFQCMHSKRD